jgi:hypothetical protein
MPGADIASAFALSNTLTRGDGTQGKRTPMEMTCFLWASKNIPPVRMMVNPHSVSFRQPKRITKRNTQGGTVFMHWTDLNGQNNDILEMVFKGRSGNIRQKPNPSSTGIVQSIGKGLQIAGNALTGTSGNPSDNPTPNQGLAKHIMWARLYELTRLPVLVPQSILRNVFTIKYQSPIFPRPYILYGFFNNVLEFTEVAEQPWLIEYSFTFVVQATQPSLDAISQQLTQLLNSTATGVANSAIETTNAQSASASGAIRGSNFSQG